MCYVLTIASSLTLSEIRSMLPAGIHADPLLPGALAAFRDALPSAQTAAHVRVGACSCDLVRPRLPDQREDERHLRGRYRARGLPRDRIIRELERHRRTTSLEPPPGGWRPALAAFVAEHARNAGPTVYRLTFEPGGTTDGPPLSLPLAAIRSDPEGWLPEGRTVVVVR